MSYYKYLEKYPAAFLRKYQTGTYIQLQRSSQYADIVNMNATQTLSLDEDITMRLKAPYNLSNFIGFMAILYWYFYHVDMYSANSLRNRLRSYQNYKMWNRIEAIAAKHSVEHGAPYRERIQQLWLDSYGLTREQYETVKQKCNEGEDVHDAFASVGLKWDSNLNYLVKIKEEEE